MRTWPWLIGLAVVLSLPAASAYEVQLTQTPGDLPLITGQAYVDPYPAGQAVRVDVVLGCDEIQTTDIVAGRDVPFQLRREVDYQVGFGFASDMPEGRFGIDPAPCLTDPGGVIQKTVTGYMAGSELAFAFVPYNVTVGVYPDETDLASPSAGMETPPTIHFTTQVEYVAGVWPTLASAHVEDGVVSFDLLLQTDANADTMFEFIIVEGPDALQLAPFHMAVSQGHTAGLASGRFPVPADATMDSVYNWTIDIGGYAVQDPTAQAEVTRVDIGIQPYKGGIPDPASASILDEAKLGDGDASKATPAPIGAVLLLAFAVWSRRSS